MISEPKLRPSERFLQLLYGRNTAEATEIGRSLLADNPRESGAARIFARLLTELGRMDEAGPCWSRLAAAEPSDIEACFHAVQAELALGAAAELALAKVCVGDNAKLADVIQPLLKQRAAVAPPAGVRHVAIAGVSYCGSTLFDRLLGGLPGVRSIGESHWLIKTYENRVAAPIDFTDPTRTRMLHCTVCGPRCQVLTLDFRTRLAADHTNWYFRIAEQLGTQIIVSADKNPSKLIENDPLLRMDMLVLFKSPVQAWVSQLDKLPKGMGQDFYVRELERYIPQWCRSYEAFLHQFKPAGKVAFASFDQFVQQPRRVVGRICAALDLPFDESVLSRTVPGHAIGGNGRAMARLRDSDYAVSIVPLEEPRLAPEQAQMLADNSRMHEAHAAMMARFQEMMTQSGDRAPSQAGYAVAAPVAAASDGRIVRFPLPSIHVIHHEGIFGDFSETVAAHLANLEERNTPGGKIKAGFFRHLLDRVDASDYADLQRTFLTPNVRDISALKYLDPVQWFDVKLNAAIKLDLHRRPPMAILDLDTGPGHFAAIAQYFGHSVTGTFDPAAPDWSERRASLYDALCNIFRVRKIELRIAPEDPLRTLAERFDLVSAFMPTFDRTKTGAAWPLEAWRFLLQDIGANVLKPDGGIFLQFASGRLTEATWEQLATEARWANQAARYVFFDNLDSGSQRVAPVASPSATPLPSRERV